MRKQHERTKAKLVALIEHWTPLVALGDVEVAHKFHATASDVTGDAEGVAAVTVSKWNYRSAVIHWYLPNIVDSLPEDMEWMVVHELCHVLNAPLEAHIKTAGNDFAELAAENVARALLATAGRPRKSVWIEP